MYYRSLPIFVLSIMAFIQRKVEVASQFLFFFFVVRNTIFLTLTYISKFSINYNTKWLNFHTVTGTILKELMLVNYKYVFLLSQFKTKVPLHDSAAISNLQSRLQY